MKNSITDRILNIIRTAARTEIIDLFPIIIQLIKFQNSPNENRQSFYDHTKDPRGSIRFYESLRNRLRAVGMPVLDVEVDVGEFEHWLDAFDEIKKYYENMGDVYIEKCLEHYIVFQQLKISDSDVYIDIAAAESPWADILNKRGVKSYRLDLAYQAGIRGINIGTNAGNTKLPNGFSSVLSLQCSYECFQGDADILFLKEANRILNSRGRYGIIPLYIEDIHFISTSPYCNKSKVKLDQHAKIVWRDDEYKIPFSRYYSPESFYERIYSRIPVDMKGKILCFKNLEQVMKHYPGQRLYCFFMFVCEKTNIQN